MKVLFLCNIFVCILAVYFEQKEFQKCIEECEKGIEIGRENRADFKLISKAFTRIANAYKKMGVSLCLLLFEVSAAQILIIYVVFSFMLYF